MLPLPWEILRGKSYWVVLWKESHAPVLPYPYCPHFFPSWSHRHNPSLLNSFLPLPPRCLSSPLHIHHPPTHLVVVLNPHQHPNYHCLCLSGNTQSSTRVELLQDSRVCELPNGISLERPAVCMEVQNYTFWIASQLVHILLVSIKYCLFPFSSLPHTHYSGIQLPTWLPELLNWCTFFLYALDIIYFLYALDISTWLLQLLETVTPPCLWHQLQIPWDFYYTLNELVVMIRAGEQKKFCNFSFFWLCFVL